MALQLTFYPNGGSMFSVKEYHDAIVEQFEARGFKWNYNHNLTGVDIQNKTAIFDRFSNCCSLVKAIQFIFTASSFWACFGKGITLKPAALKFQKSITSNTLVASK